MLHEIFYLLQCVLQKKYVSLHRSKTYRSNMYKSKLISVRVNEETLSALDDAVRKSSVYSRSNAINAAMRLLAVAIDKGYFYKIIRFDPQFDEIDSFEFEYHQRK